MLKFSKLGHIRVLVIWSCSCLNLDYILSWFYFETWRFEIWDLFQDQMQEYYEIAGALSGQVWSVNCVNVNGCKLLLTISYYCLLKVFTDFSTCLVLTGFLHLNDDIICDNSFLVSVLTYNANAPMATRVLCRIHFSISTQCFLVSTTVISP